MVRVLLLEDDQKLSNSIAKLIRTEGWSVTECSSLPDFYELPLANFDVLILDRLLGSTDTKEHFKAIKKAWADRPIIVLSAINTPLERAELINLGAEDYIGKPFSAQELIARVRRLATRTNTSSAYRILGNTVLETSKRTITVDGKSESLPSKEFLLFKTLADDQGRVFRKEELMEVIWGFGMDVESNVVEATLTNLRRRLEKVGSNLTIKNARNSGYWLEV